MTLYAIWATATLAAIAFSWRRDVIRLRTQARIVPDAIAASRALTTHDATGNVTEVADRELDVFLAQVREAQR